MVSISISGAVYAIGQQTWTVMRKTQIMVGHPFNRVPLFNVLLAAAFLFPIAPPAIDFGRAHKTAELIHRCVRTMPFSIIPADSACHQTHADGVGHERMAPSFDWLPETLHSRHLKKMR